MSELIESTDPKGLKWLLELIHQQELALPDFQRNFVWEPPATQELIASIAKDFPAGSLLTIRNTKDFFAAREIKGAPELKQKATYLALDGQQRLTSLYQAFYGKGDYKYFINIKALLEKVDIEDAIFHVKANAKKGKHAKMLRDYDDIKIQSERLVFPLSDLFGEKHGFSGWINKVAKNTKGEGIKEDLRDKLMAVQENIISNIEKYRFPVVMLSDKSQADAVCTIFETLNRTGVKLSVFDLLASRFWPHEVKLRDMWASAKKKFPILEDFVIDPYYILQVLSLLVEVGAPSCKRGDVLSLKHTHVKNNWDKAVKGMADALNIMQDDCGVLIPRWIPYNTMLITFAALLAKYQIEKGLKAGKIRAKIIHWFWYSVFAQAYENAANSQSAKDFAEIGAWLEGGKIPKHIENFSFDSELLSEVTPSQRALYNGVIALIISRGPKDFHDYKPLTRNLIEKNHVDDHHIFPKAFLREELGVSEVKTRDCVLNRTLIDRSTNQSINDSNPLEYLSNIGKELGKEKLKKLLESHLLPADKDSPLMKNDYDKFLEWRCEKLGEEIKRVTGASE